MTTISTILESHPDGTLHLPVPEGLRNCKVRIEAKLELAAEPADDDVCEEERRQKMFEVLEKLAQQNPFKDIKDPVAWQREMREDRPLPGRD